MAKPTLEQRIAAAVEAALADRFAHVLADIDWRISQARQMAESPNPAGRQVYAEDLNLPHAVLTGYTVTNNSPAAGSIAWADLHVVYAGVDNTITNGNTNKRYAWWSPTTTPTQLITGDTKPVLAQGEVLIFINNGGTAIVALSDTNASLPRVLSDGAVDSGALIAGSVGSTAIADKAVGTGQIADNAINSGQIAGGAVIAGKLGTNAVATGNIADSAVASGKIADKAVATGKLADSAVTATQLANNSVTDTKLLDGAVSTNKLANGAVGSTKLADNAVGPTKIADNAVGTTKIADNAVNSGKLATGAVSAQKLNILSHLLY